MTVQIRNGAWWCRYCGHCVDGACSKEVPYYASSPYCKEWVEHVPLKPYQRKHRFNIKRVLVEVI